MPNTAMVGMHGCLACGLSHWILDFLVHRPDLPLWPGRPKVGLGLWNSWIAEVVIEVGIFAAGLWI